MCIEGFVRGEKNIMIDIDILAEMNVEFNNKKKELETYKSEVKLNGVGSYKGNRYTAIVEERTSSSFDVEEATKIAKANGMKWVLKQVVDEALLEDEIAQGHIDGKLFAGCVKTKSTQAIKFVKNK